MKKLAGKMAALMAVVMMVFSFSTPMLANTLSQTGWCCSGRCGGVMRSGTMWDDDGNFLTREAFEARLDGWIADGIISAQSRASMLERFDWCGAYGGGATGFMGACGGFGGGWRGGRGMMRGWQ